MSIISFYHTLILLFDLVAKIDLIWLDAKHYLINYLLLRYINWYIDTEHSYTNWFLLYYLYWLEWSVANCHWIFKTLQLVINKLHERCNLCIRSHKEKQLVVIKNSFTIFQSINFYIGLTLFYSDSFISKKWYLIKSITSPVFENRWPHTIKKKALGVK